MPKTLFVTDRAVFPPSGGAPLRMWQNINIMMNHGEVALFSVVPRRDSSIQDRPPGITVWKSFHGKDLAQQRNIFRKIENKLWRFRPYGEWWADDLFEDHVAQELRHLLEAFKPDLVILEEIWIHRYLNILKNFSAFIIYDAHNVEFELFQQIEASFNKRSRNRFFQWFKTSQKVKRIERKLIHSVDQIWACSQADKQKLEEIYRSDSPIHIIPNAIDVSHYENIDFEAAKSMSNISPEALNLIFVGTFSYRPNSIAAEILIRTIFPEIRNIYPEANLLLVGKEPTHFMKKATKNKESGIVVTGQVDDVRPYLAASTIAVVPLTEGSGTRLKILEAFASGCPVISTHKGAEGIEAVDNKHILIRDEIGDIVQAIVRLASNSKLRNKISNAAHELVSHAYSWASISPKINTLIGETKAI